MYYKVNKINYIINIYIFIFGIKNIMKLINQNSFKKINVYYIFVIIPFVLLTLFINILF